MRSVLVVVALTVCAAAFAQPVTLTDDFSGYAAGSDGSPKWSTDVVSWEVRDGKYEFSGAGSPAMLANQPRYRTLTMEATVLVRKATNPEWKVVGLGFIDSPGNRWHLALVESPDNQNSRHLVELAQGKDGAWPTSAGTKTVVDDGMNLNWQFNTPYRLRISLTAKGVEGEVSDMAGKRLARKVVEFTGDAVKQGRPHLQVGNLQGSFDDLKIVAADPVPESPAAEKTLPPYAVASNGTFTERATGFFHTVKRDGRWWLVDPKGKAFYAIGTDHCRYSGHGCQTLGYSPYQRKNDAKWQGDRNAWAIQATDRLKSWGFNLIGAGNGQEARYKGLAHTEFISFGASFSSSDNIVEKTTWTGFPNVFSPKWPAYCDRRAREACAEKKNDPWLFGYFLDNELEWYGKAHIETGLFEEAMLKPAGHTAKTALIKYLQDKYPTVGDLNKAWGISLKSFDDLQDLSTLTGPNTDTVKADKLGYTRLVAEMYFKYTTEAIRRHDPNHMIIGCRFAGNAPAGIWDINGKYCDIVTFNSYPRIDLETEDVSDLIALYSDYYKMAQKPMMLTEWSFPALDSGLPCKHGAGMRVDTQTQRTQCFRIYQEMLFRLPFMVGSDFFMWVDEPALGISDTFPEDSNYGLVNEDDVPYPELTAMATKVNPTAAKLHGRDYPQLSVTEDLKVRNHGMSAVTTKVRVRLDGQVKDTEMTLAPGAEMPAPVIRSTAPGGHLVVVEVDPDHTSGDQNLSDNLVAKALWVPGIKAPAADQSRSAAALVVTNASAEPQKDAVVLVRLADLPLAARFKTTLGAAQLRVAAVDGTPLPSQVVGDQIAVSMADLPAWACRTLLVYRSTGRAALAPKPGIEVQTSATAVSLSNGALKLEWNKPSEGNVVDRICLGNTLLGSYNPLIWQEVDGQNQWVKADSGDLTTGGVPQISLGPAACVVNVTTTGGSAKPITTVDEAGKQQAQQARPVGFRISHQLLIPVGTNWFLARLNYVENISNRPLILKSYFFYLNGLVGGSAEDDHTAGVTDVPNYYSAAGGVWQDAKVGYAYGCWPLTSAITTNFWLDAGGSQHPDARRVLADPVTLQPGQRYIDADSPWLLVYGGKIADKPWSSAKATAKRLSGLSVEVKAL
jgi:hypothetical protein